MLHKATKHATTLLKLSEAEPESSVVDEDTLRDPERPKYLVERLKHRFVPFGVKFDPISAPAAMDLDTESRAQKSKIKKGGSTSKRVCSTCSPFELLMQAMPSEKCS